jgi:hypothetical protein
MAIAQFKEKVDSMLPELMEAIRKECDRLYSCGGVNTDAFDDDYQLPKICLTVALENQIQQYRPLNRIGKKVVANLRHF